MPIILIHDINDPRLAPFRDLKDKNLASRHGLFIVEGEHLVRRLLASDYQTHSLLVQESRLPVFQKQASSLSTFAVTASQISQIVGFKFHRGVLALAYRRDELSVENLLSKKADLDRLVILPEINDVENLGGLMRTAAALGYDHLILGPSCCDAFARRAIRTSMGAVFKVKIARSNDLISDLSFLKQRYSFKLFGTAIGEESSLPTGPEKLGILFGSEANGLSHEILSLCDDHITINMSCGVDSLNVVVAAGILLNHYRRAH